MKITRVEPIVISVPYTHGGPPTGFGGRRWTTLDYLLVRVETDEGLVGYGEAFGYNVIPATRAAVAEVVAPLVIGTDSSDIAGTSERLARTLHLFGRSGPVVYARSGIDLALWDLAGKRAGVPVHRLLGAAPRHSVPAYASLLWLGDEASVAKECTRALDAGFSGVKLHETDADIVLAARAAIGPDPALMTDVNCHWSASEAVEAGARFAPADLTWWEEPVWPPEAAHALGDVREAVSIPLASGENATTTAEFAALAGTGRCDILQPSVTKVGGISGFLDVARPAVEAGATLVPHSPYFGPGLLATLHLAAAFPQMPWLEYLWAHLERPIFGDVGRPGPDGRVRIPTGPGLGADPDPLVLERYRVA